MLDKLLSLVVAPHEIIKEFDLLDDGNPLDPPRFICKDCQGEMIPEYYKNHAGIIYDNKHLGSNDYN